jgi:hypothetical protein
MKALKLIFALFLIQNVALGQIRELEFNSYPDSLSRQITFSKIAIDLVGKDFATDWLFIKDHIEFNSLSEFEEITGLNIEKKNGRYILLVNVISHEYTHEKRKTLSKFEIEYIDGREGLIYDRAKLLKLKKLNSNSFIETMIRN